jgi:hypothetical protein
MSSRLQVESRNNRGVSEMFRALRHRNFRLFWSGAFLSNTGTWMQAVAQGWLVLSISDSPFYLGLDGFMATAPGLFLTLAGGVFADFAGSAQAPDLHARRFLAWLPLRWGSWC